MPTFSNYLDPFPPRHNGSRTMRGSQLTLISSLIAPDLHISMRWLRCCCAVLIAMACADFLADSRALQAAESLAADSSNPASGSMVVAEPYLVFVAEEAAHLRCGPAGEYYRTDALRHGQELEVYVETQDGWLGVRPIEDSFCWVPADATRILPADTSGDQKADALQAEIVEDKTVSWIGTNLGRARRYRWQVQLGKGENVTILGRSERDGPDGPQTWYRIVPPSGEFRWIHRDQVVSTAEELLASVKGPRTAQESIEFLPAGPSYAAVQPARMERSTAARGESSLSNVGSSVLSTGGLRRVSDDQPYREGGPAESTDDRSEALAEIRRLDEIERNIEARSRNRFERESDVALSDQAAEAKDEHHLRSFSQRVTERLSTLIGGGRVGEEQLEPATSSSRRQPELVPIGSGLAITNTADPMREIPREIRETAQPIGGPDLQRVAEGVSPSASTSVVTASPAVSPAEAEPTAKTVPATNQAGLRTGESQVAILSPPRMVSQQPGAFLSTANALPPAKLRTITAEQLREVQQSVSSATAESLPMVMSSLMARGASAPEIRIVADAAQALALNELAQRARDYEALARRRDGDTVVAISTTLPPTFGQPSEPPVTGAPPRGFETRQLATAPPQAPGPILPATYQAGAQPGGGGFVPATAILPSGLQQPEPAPVEQSGVLVEVYSADPNRPPFAITDRTGQTVAYVTPAPGVELRSHLGSQVRLRGETGFLQGLDTPHVLATAAERVIR